MENLVSLKTGLHRRLHTFAYYQWVNDRVVSAYYSAGRDRALQRIYVLNTLYSIRNYLLILNTGAPY